MIFGSVASVACGGQTYIATRPFSFLPSSSSHSSPLALVVPSGRVNSPSPSSMPVCSANTENVAFSPAAPPTNGWMWIRPSWWVWMPLVSGPESPGLGRISPQMSMPNAACQWSWLATGASLADTEASLPAKNTRTDPTTRMPTMSAGYARLRR